jgi:hypothetical protein
VAPNAQGGSRQRAQLGVGSGTQTGALGDVQAHTQIENQQAGTTGGAGAIMAAPGHVPQGVDRVSLAGCMGTTARPGVACHHHMPDYTDQSCNLLSDKEHKG